MKQFYIGTLLVIWFLAEFGSKFGGVSPHVTEAREFGKWNKTPLEQPENLEHQFSFLPCDTRVSGVYTYCNPDNPGTFFVGFVAIDPTGTTRQVKDLGGAHGTNLGKHVESLPNNEPAGTTTTPLIISGIGADTIEHWLFGPYPNGATFNIALVDTTAAMCDTVKVASGMFNCEDYRSAPDSACTDVVPLYYFDFSATTFDVPSASSNEVFLFMDRSRVATCCGVSSSQRCFEFIIRLNDNDVGLDLSAAGSGAQGSDLYAAPLAGFNCSNSVPGNNDPWHVFVNNNADPVICLGNTVKEWIVLTCKAGANPTSAIVDAVSGPNINDSVTIEPCILNITATNTNDPKWSSYDDPTLKNIIGYSGVDSSVALFLYDESFYGPVSSCAGDTFHYVLSSLPPSSPCFSPNIRLLDTAAVIVYPTFTVNLSQACDMTGTMIKLTADTASVAKGCPYTFTWYDLATPGTIVQTGPSNMLTVGAVNGEKYRVVVTRSDLLSSVNSCSPVADTIMLIAGAQINCDLVLPKDTLVQCIADTLRSNLGLITFDGCYAVPPTVTVKDINDGGKGCKGDTLKIRRLYIAEVSTGVFDTCIQRFNIVDTIPPSPAFLTSDKTIECNSFTLINDTSVAIVGPAIPGTDNCEGRVILTHRDSIVAGVCPARDTILRLWKSSDTCGNFRIQVQRIIRVDTRPPIPSFVPRDTTVVCVGNIPAPLTLMGLDSCQGMVTATVKDTVFAMDSVCLDKKLVRRTYTYKDLCGNMTNSLQLIRVNDSIAPILTCPPNITVTCVADTPVSNTTLVTAMDNCGSHVRVYHAKDSVSTADPAPCINKRIFYRIYQGLDTCNNIGSCVQVIRVNDSIAPVITCPFDTLVSCRSSVPIPNTGLEIASDNCGSQSRQAFSVMLNGPNESPANASPGTGTGTVTIDFNLKTMRVQVMFSGLTGNTTASHIHAATVVAGAGIAGVATVTPTFTGFPLGVTSGTYDNTFDMTLAGSYNPAYVTANGGTLASAFTALTTAMNEGKSYLNIHTSTFGGGEIRGFLIPRPDATMVAWVQDSIPSADSTCINNLTIYRKYSATDECDNVSYCTQKITVKDTIAPIILGVPGDTIVDCSSSIPALPIVTAIDNCSLVRLEYHREVLDSNCINQKTILNIWTATDTCQNKVIDTQTVKVNDTIAPILLGVPRDTMVDCAGSIPTLPTVTAMDNCSLVRLDYRREVPDSNCINQKTILNIWTATDTCHNMIVDSQTVIVNDTVAPIFTTFPKDTTYDCIGNVPPVAGIGCLNCVPVAPDLAPTALDNCGEVMVQYIKDTVIDSTCINKKTILRIWSATDLCNNMIRDTQMIMILDTIPPQFTIPNNIDTLECGQIFDIVFPGAPAQDNCDGSVMIKSSISIIDSTCPGNYKILLTFTARDTCGNTRTLTDTIVKLDRIPPIIECPQDIETVNCDDIPPPFATLDSFLAHGGTITDMCCIDSASFESLPQSSVSKSGTLTIFRKYVIHDCCGLTDTCMQTIIVPPCFLDLALKKEINGPTPFFTAPGGIIPFKITVFNQLDVPADSIKLIDYLPCPTCTIITPGWVNNGNSTACLTLSRANGLLPASGLLLGDSVVVTFDLKLGNGAFGSTGINTAEIFSAQDTFHNTLDDIDSDPNSVPGDDPGGIADGASDNVVDGDGTGTVGVDDPMGDEDDQDPALFFICNSLICNDKVNVSLDINCEHCFSAADVLQGNVLPDNFYDIEITDASGRKIESTCIGREWLGYQLTYKVTSHAPCPINSCWGYVVLEDKRPPLIDCRPDTVTCFELAQLPHGSYTVKDNCGDSTKVVIASETFTDYGCGEPGANQMLQGKVSRRLIASDVWGNSIDCTKDYFILKIELDSIVCPADFELGCGSTSFAPSAANAPKVNTPKGIKSLWPNNASCKISLLYTDKKVDICDKSYKIIRTWIITDWCTGKEKTCTQTISILDKVAPAPTNKVLADLNADPHNCGQYVDLPALAYSDCNSVTQTYTLKYDEEGKIRILSGSLPASRVWLPLGTHHIVVDLVDACNNFSKGSITVSIKDITPPTPVCVEYTQVTVDPASCWAAIAAKDLNSGSHDNCISQLLYAAALMSDIEKARADYAQRISDSCGKVEYWNNKAWYDAYIEQWINCYVFSDTVHFDDCGSNQVVMRVYEADSMPRLDPHLWSCGEHAWFCYNTYPHYRTIHNIAFYGDKTKDCYAKGPWLCKEATAAWFAQSKRQEFAVSYYYGANAGVNFPQTHLYNDCMVQVLVDDKQAPVVAGLQDITVYCDGVNGLFNISGTPGAPGGSTYVRTFCSESERFSTWPGTIKDGNGTIHGYYGGSTYIVNHTPGNDHSDQTGCPTDQWSPIYCRKWLLLDSFDNAGQINPKDYFDQLVKFDKNRPSRALKGNEFSITDNCKLDDASLKVTDAGSLNGCGEGWIQRTWTMTDRCGNPVTAIQKIIVKHRSDFEVIFPADLEVSCDPETSGGDAVDTSHTGRPVISDEDCEQVGMRYEDEISTVTDGACYKIIRTWTLIDWCIYDPNAHTIHPDVIVDDRLRANETDRACIMRNLKDNGDGYMKYVQIIKITDHQAPIVTCKDTTVCITEGCKTIVNIPLAGTDNCAEKVLFRIDITYPDLHTESRVDVTAITGSFIEGIYKVKIIGRDHCGNEDTCQMNLTVKDCKAPTPYCLNGVATVLMPSSGSIQIWATDLDRASADNCTATNKLKFSFSKNTADASRVLSCSDILNGREQAIELSIWVTDEAGNADFCKTYILLQDAGGLAGGVCKDTTIAMASVTGKLKTEYEEGVEFATVEVTGGGSAGIPSFKTKSDGSYLFGSIPMNANQIIRANRDDNPINGVSTLDLILIQKHILGTEQLNSAYKVIAADVNNSDDVSVLDLIELRKLILGIYDKLPNNTSWKFVPQSHKFTDIQNPWGYPTEEKLHDMKDIMQKDFVGVKIGDVNSSALAHSLMGTEIRGTGAGLVLDVTDQSYNKGDKVSIQFRSSNFKGISGFQGTVSIDDNSLKFDQELPGVLKMNNQNFGRRWEKEGQITMSWNASDSYRGQSVDLGDEDILFTLIFTASSDGRLSDVLHLSSQRTLAESYEGKGEVGTLGIRFMNTNGVVEVKSTLYQNYPNPFDQRSVIGLQLSEQGRGILKISDITGRTLKVIDQEWNRGYQEIWLDRRNIRASGILYYSFESLPSGAGRGFKAVKKMIILD